MIRNVKKITFCKHDEVIRTEYKIGNPKIQEVDAVRDLGVIMDNKWSFDDLINGILAKSFKTLKFIKRITQGFSSLDTITYLFKALILPCLNFASTIWTPRTKEKYDKLNSIITKFLRYAAYKSGNPMSYDEHEYSAISRRCKYNDLKIKCLWREISYNLRCFRPLVEEIDRRDYIRHAPIQRLVSYWNELDEDLRSYVLDNECKYNLKEEVLELL